MPALLRLTKLLAPALALGCLLAGCGITPEFVNVVDHDAALLQDTVNAFFQAVDNREAQAIQALFSPSVQQPGLEAAIQQLLAVYPGPTDNCQMSSNPGSSRHIGRQRRANTHNWFPVEANGVNYYCYFSYTYRDDAQPDNIGIEKLILVSEKVRCNPDFLASWASLPPGLTVQVEAPGDYQTCRIGDEAFIYTPVERALTRQDILAFLAAEDSWAAFEQHFGQPNAADPYTKGYYYELAEEEGRVFAHVVLQSQNEEWRIYSVNLLDDQHYQALEVIWQTAE